MSLGIAFKGPEGIVLAADSRVTLTAQIPGQSLRIPVTYDNATKLLKVESQNCVGAVTYGLGALGQREFRTAHSYVPEFEEELAKRNINHLSAKRLSVGDFAQTLSDFFMRQWASSMPQDYQGPEMIFLVAGYDPGAPYGRVFEIGIPGRPSPKEWHANAFGAIWGGQREFTDRLIQGFDPGLPLVMQQALKLSDEQRDELENELRQKLGTRIPFDFLPLQDCVDLSIFLIQATRAMQTWQVGLRGVGGAIDVATITRTDGFTVIQQKKIHGEASSA